MKIDRFHTLKYRSFSCSTGCPWSNAARWIFLSAASNCLQADDLQHCFDGRHTSAVGVKQQNLVSIFCFRKVFVINQSAFCKIPAI